MLLEERGSGNDPLSRYGSTYDGNKRTGSGGDRCAYVHGGILLAADGARAGLPGDEPPDGSYRPSGRSRCSGRLQPTARPQLAALAGENHTGPATGRKPAEKKVPESRQFEIHPLPFTTTRPHLPDQTNRPFVPFGGTTRRDQP